MVWKSCRDNLTSAVETACDQITEKLEHLLDLIDDEEQTRADLKDYVYRILEILE